MAFLTRDIVEASRSQLCACDPSRIPLALAQHLLRRQIGSVKAISIIPLIPGDLAAGSRDAVLGQEPCPGDGGRKLRHHVGHRCQPPVSHRARSRAGGSPGTCAKTMWLLVWGYERDGDRLTLYTYDSNFPGWNDIAGTYRAAQSMPRRRMVRISGTSKSMRLPGWATHWPPHMNWYSTASRKASPMPP
jgi:hypothetical protein